MSEVELVHSSHEFYVNRLQLISARLFEGDKRRPSTAPLRRSTNQPLTRPDRGLFSAL